MNLLLIAPSSGPWRHIGRRTLFNGRTFRFSLLSLLSVAAQTPADVRIRIVDEQIEDIPWDAEADLVGITNMTALAPRAYEIADAFSARGIPVVLGGMHPTFMPEEALGHADAVVAGEVEGAWQRVLADARAGRLAGVYRSEAPPDLRGLPLPPRGLLDPKGYATVNAIQATRGCPHRCDFCAVTAFHENRFRKRPVEDVVREAASFDARGFIFVDDNLTADRRHARALCEGLAPLGKLWVAQSTLQIAHDADLLAAMAAAGCIGVFVGLETFSESNLDSMNKRFNRVGEYREAVAAFHRAGIGVEAGVVFGFDHDRADVFEATLRALEEIEIDVIQASIFTPLPGTPQFDARAPRIFDRNWARYDFHHVVHQPSGMSAEALQAGHDWVTREFYRPWRIARRVARRAAQSRGLRSAGFSATLNAAYYGRVRNWGIKGWNPVATAAPAPGRREAAVPAFAGLAGAASGRSGWEKA